MIAFLLFLWQIRPSFPYEEDPAPVGPPEVTHV